MPTKRFKAFLVGLELHSSDGLMSVEESLDELGALTDTLGIEVVGQTFQRLRSPNPATLVGSGKLLEIKAWADELDVDLVVFDDELSPRHQRELERFFGDKIRVLDRTTLVLDIFAQHARTQESALQVSLAQYEYRLPRLTKQWTHLARQVGAGGSIGVGGVGLRGPGETQLETDRREIKRRISKLRGSLKEIRAHRERQRTRRQHSGIAQAVLVGYTNVGKSTLLNAVCDAKALVANQFFATLDPTTRRLELGGGEVALLSDTVGVIHKLPHHLIATFRSTLEEVGNADLLIHVVDASHPDALRHISIVDELVASLTKDSAPKAMMVLNKLDAVVSSPEQTLLASLQNSYPDALLISAARKIGLGEFTNRVRTLLRSTQTTTHVFIPYSDPEMISRFYQVAYDVTQTYADEGVELSGIVRAEGLRDLNRYIVG